MNEDVYVVGKDKAITSLVLGIVSIISCFTGIGSIVGLVTGIIGLVFANKAKKVGYYGGIQTGGFVTSLVGLIISSLVILFAIFVLGSILNVLGTYADYGRMYTWY